MANQICVLCGVTYTAPAHLKGYQGLCEQHYNRDVLREWDRLESARKRLAEGVPNTLTLSEWLAIVTSYRGQCALCEMAPLNVCAIWIPAAGLVAGNTVPLCRICHFFKEHSFISAIDRVSAQLEIQQEMIV